MLQHQTDKRQYKITAKSNQHIQIKPSWPPVSCANYAHPYKESSYNDHNECQCFQYLTCDFQGRYTILQPFHIADWWRILSKNVQSLGTCSHNKDYLQQTNHPVGKKIIANYYNNNYIMDAVQCQSECTWCKNWQCTYIHNIQDHIICDYLGENWPYWHI